MSYKLAGVIWDDDGNLAPLGKILTADIKPDYFTQIHISDSIENLYIHYKGKEYKFNLEKVLNLLADVVEDTTVINK